MFKGEEDGATESKSSKNWQDVDEEGQHYERHQEYVQRQPRSRYQSSHNSGYSGEYRRAFAVGNRGNNKQTWYRNRGPSHSQHGSNYQYSQGNGYYRNQQHRQYNGGNNSERNQPSHTSSYNGTSKGVPTQSDTTSLKKGVTLEAGEIIKVGNTTLRIDFLTKSNGEKVAQLKEVT